MNASGKPRGSWAEVNDGLRDANHELQGAHVGLHLAFGHPDYRNTAGERITKRAKAVFAMRDACNAWIAAMERVIDAAEDKPNKDGP